MLGIAVRPKVVIFDCDGTLVDSETLYLDTFNATLALFGVPRIAHLSKQEWGKRVGTHRTAEAARLAAAQGIQVEPADFKRLWLEEFLSQAKIPGNLQMCAGFDYLYPVLRRSGCLLAVASSGEAKSLKDKIQNGLVANSRTGLTLTDFDVILSGEDVSKQKPDPEIYMMAAERLSVRPDECLVFEDSASGVAAARAAGMHVFAVPNEFTSGQDGLEIAHAVLASFAEAVPLIDSVPCISPSDFRATLVSPGVVLDIDNTLADTHMHWINILVAKFGTPDQTLSPKALHAKYRYVPLEEVPCWSTDECQAYIKHMAEDPMIQARGIPVIDDAVEGVQQLQSLLGVVGYVTVRPCAAVVHTRAWLLSHGFPDLPIVARPRDVPHDAGNMWKGRILADLFPTVTGIVDDSTTVLRACGDDYPGLFFLFDSSLEEVPSFCVPCRTWPDVVDAVKRSGWIGADL